MAQQHCLVDAAVAKLAEVDALVLGMGVAFQVLNPGQQHGSAGIGRGQRGHQRERPAAAELDGGATPGICAGALLEMVAACGIGLFLGFVLKATYSAARISWSQERMLKQAREAQAEAARAREITEWQLDPYDRLPL
jgi:hypothetical protein